MYNVLFSENVVTNYCNKAITWLIDALRVLFSKKVKWKSPKPNYSEEEKVGVEKRKYLIYSFSRLFCYFRVEYL